MASQPSRDNPSDSDLANAEIRMRRLVNQAMARTETISSHIRRTQVLHDGLPTNEITPSTLASEIVLDFDSRRYSKVTHATGTIRTTIRSLDTRKAVKDYAESRSGRELVTIYAPYALAAKVHRAYDQVRGASPVHDDDGNELSGIPARVKRIAIEWFWDCELNSPQPIDGHSQNARWVRQAIQAYGEDSTKTSDDLETAKQQCRERFDANLMNRCKYLFESEEPNNLRQETARFAMLKARQVLMRSLKTAGTVADAMSDLSTAITTIEAVTVESSPTWQKVSGDPITAVPPVLASAYTKGRTRWHLDLHAYTATALDKREGHGAVEVEPLISNDFELTDLAGATHGDAKVRIRRKGNGHPAAGTYTLPITARNFEGPTVLTVTITVT